MNASTAEAVWGGYFPGVIGQATALQAAYYARDWGFDSRFEIQVAGEMADFMARFQDGRDLLLSVRQGDSLSGVLFVDGAPEDTHAGAHDAVGPNTARLRWFMVDPATQGRGLGRELMERALTFCREKAFAEVFLWTFGGLAPARRLYDAMGFELTQEFPAAPWGPTIPVQRFTLALDAGA